VVLVLYPDFGSGSLIEQRPGVGWRRRHGSAHDLGGPKQVLMGGNLHVLVSPINLPCARRGNAGITYVIGKLLTTFILRVTRSGCRGMLDEISDSSEAVLSLNQA
jgi:hypothetical protein